MRNDQGISRRAALAGGAAIAGAALVPFGGGSALASVSAAAPRRRPLRVLVATNEPWGTYHVSPLLDEAARRGWSLTQLVPDMSQIKPGDPVKVATPDQVTRADLLVVNGASDWPVACAERFRHLPLAASSLAYLNPEEVPGARKLRRRLRVITASSAAEARSFAAYLGTGTRRTIAVVGSAQTDALPVRKPEPGLVLVLTSVTHPDPTGGAAPGTELLLAAADKLHAAGRHILVGLHPREDRKLWEKYEISAVPSIQASARAEAAIGIPGTVFPLVAAVGTPVVGCIGPALTVPGYLLSVCSSTIRDAGQAVPAIEQAHLPSADVLKDAVGPVGGSAHRLMDAWSLAVRSHGHHGHH
ncbi:hypothetical protein J4573_45420 [Actinomadura barringtoniae]|uniref:Uncharacterized protein n=1 Tax=Actinomadura barringtoniae TaxID=1427535 RepID=A0A939PKN7_9ACTN|nr:hypothetical protein [Actinomadura barringtoniae]MBO2454395.1 hypothetical protein [Actinomadura barringtoniae]